MRALVLRAKLCKPGLTFKIYSKGNVLGLEDKHTRGKPSWFSW